jgi:cytochrome c biogenesis protein CcmG, thiol:disulfide interchange protein DsbE
MSRSRRTERAERRSRARQAAGDRPPAESRRAAADTRRATIPATRGRAPARRWIVLVLVIVAAAAAIAIVARGMPSGTTAVAPATSGPSSSPRPESTVSLDPATSVSGLVEGPALAPFEAGAPDATVGQPIPGISGAGFDGQPIAVRPDDGRPKIVIFLTHWCSHCQAEVPRIQSWLDAEGAPSTVDLYAVSSFATPERPNYPPDAWLQREHWSVPTIVDDGGSSVAHAYGLNAFPYWVFVRADGTVARRASGELTIEDLERTIDQLVG